MKCLLLLLLLPAIVQGTKTQFNVNYTIRCSENKPFTYKIELFEWDRFGDDNLASTTGSGAAGQTNTGVIHGTDDGDEFLSPIYDLRMRIVHNCGNEMACGDKFYVGGCSLDTTVCNFQKEIVLGQWKTGGNAYTNCALARPVGVLGLV